MASSEKHESWLSFITTLTSTQKAVALIVVLWLATIPIGCLNVYLGTVIGKATSRLLESYWVRQYSNDGGLGFLPSIEIPVPWTPPKGRMQNDSSYSSYTANTSTFLEA